MSRREKQLFVMDWYRNNLHQLSSLLSHSLHLIIIVILLSPI
ncbi:MAG: hypothetical protein WC960_06875 [Bacteroidales bacterium]